MLAMDPQRTVVAAPVRLRIADDIRIAIERGDLAPGDPLPTLQELARTWKCSIGVAREAVALLKTQGLITGGRGKAPTVRQPHRRICRSSERHQAEKDLVRASEEERSGQGASEIDLGVPLDHLKFSARYDVIPAGTDLGAVFGIKPSDKVLRRVYETVDPSTDHRQAWSVSYLPHSLVAGHPDLLNSDLEPWPGGTQHQLYTIGIEIVRMDDEVSAEMPSTVDMQLWGMEEGVPMLKVRRISVDTDDRAVEVSDAEYPADRTELKFVTPLRKW